MVSVDWKFSFRVTHEVVCDQEVPVGCWLEMQPKAGLNEAGGSVSKVALPQFLSVWASPHGMVAGIP